MKTPSFFFLFLFSAFVIQAQTNIVVTHALADKILKAQYNPADFGTTLTSSKSKVLDAIVNLPRTDSMLSYLKQMEAFYTRNTGSDTMSEMRGIGAARRWALEKFRSFSNRLNVSYLQFNQNLCSFPQHRNIFAVLPGTDTSLKDAVLVEAHLDSRCETACDTSCIAQGMEDNGSGCALVLELARCLSTLTFKRSIVFVLTIAEEQGLDGARAFATYFKNNNIALRAVLNNDVVGGIVCGKTASPPGCPGENDIDSINLRIFSAGTHLSPNKSLARFVKLEYDEELHDRLAVKTVLNIMNAEDRTGRGGDHIPFKEKGYIAIRFTSANEHGDASAGAGYTDRQHSVRDVLGKDLNADGTLDSMYVNLNYLKRNLQINGNAIAMAAMGPKAVNFSLANDGNGIGVLVTSPEHYPSYRIGLRSRSNAFDTVYYSWQKDFRIFGVKKDSIYFVSVASVDENGIESVFPVEQYAKVLDAPPSSVLQLNQASSIQLFDAMPNPFDESTTITIFIEHHLSFQHADLNITDMQGKLIKSEKLDLGKQLNEVLFEHEYLQKGIYFYTLVLDGKAIATKKMLLK